MIQYVISVAYSIPELSSDEENHHFAARNYVFEFQRFGENVLSTIL